MTTAKWTTEDARITEANSTAKYPESKLGETGIAKNGGRYVELRAGQFGKWSDGQAVTVEANGETFALTVTGIGGIYQKGGKDYRRIYVDPRPVAAPAAQSDEDQLAEGAAALARIEAAREVG